jgi:hypothetical protein
MQATHYIDEVARKGGQRPECTLDSHYDFAEEVLGEKRSLTQPQAVQQGHVIFHDLLVFTSDRTWIFFAWSLEVFWLFFILTATTMEMWGSCAFDIHLWQAHTHCSYCYSNAFVLFLGVLLVIWTFNLYTYMLLLSRGFQLKLRFLGLTVDKNRQKGIPSNAILLFLTLSVLMFLWAFVGIIILINSQECLRAEVVVGNKPGRSVVLWMTSIFTILSMPLFFFFGRCDDAKGAVRQCCIRY